MMIRSLFKKTAIQSLLLLLLTASALFAQSPELSLDGLERAGLDSLYRSMRGDLVQIPPVKFEAYVWKGTSLLNARQTFVNHYNLGERTDPKVYTARALIKLLNRINTFEEDLKMGDTLFVPQPFGLDFRAYAPLPRMYEKADKFEKLVVVDKATQTFAAYHQGKMKRWGYVVTGKSESPTPNGRFNINWKQDARISSLSPGLQPAQPGKQKSTELWYLKWVMNLHETRGIHFHQYYMPTTGPASHGCIRLAPIDAKWLYDWTDTWKVTVDSAMVCGAGTRCKIEKQGTTVLILRKDPKGKPRMFKAQGTNAIPLAPILPADPYSVAAGSPQQKQFDAIRIAEERRRAEAERRRQAEARRNQNKPKPKMTPAKPAVPKPATPKPTNKRAGNP